MRRATIARVFLPAMLGVACLPADVRPPPASVLVTVKGSTIAKEGFTTDDGWTIAVDKFLVSLGNAGLTGDPCTGYSQADYRRIFDGRTVEPQKLSILYALGTCGFRFRSNNASVDSVLSANVTEADKTMMTTPGTDKYADVSGMSMYLKGSAKKGAVTKTFAWAFRSRRVSYNDCKTERGAEPFQIVLQSNDSREIQIDLHVESIFQDKIDRSKSKSWFSPFADADDKAGNKDSEVTLDELGLVTIDDVGLGPADFVDGDLGDAGVAPIDDAGDGDAGVTTWKTFEDYVYLGLFPRVARMGNGTCVMGIGGGRR